MAEQIPTGLIYLNGFVPDRTNDFFGKLRRDFIKKLFLANPTAKLAVNNRWQIPLHKDPDLEKLVKDGFLSKSRSGSGKRQTCLSMDAKTENSNE